MVPNFSPVCTKSHVSYLIHFACCLSLKVSWCGSVQTRKSVLRVLSAWCGHMAKCAPKTKVVLSLLCGVQAWCSGRPPVVTWSRWKTVVSVGMVCAHLWLKSFWQGGRHSCQASSFSQADGNCSQIHHLLHNAEYLLCPGAQSPVLPCNIYQ